jgi:phosphoribosylformimino-5-aminoimidazole carboxamide ribotide isomerase
MSKKVEGYKQKIRVIPVIDILDGVVVHAVKGQRREYKPIQSTLTTAVEPLAVAKTFKNLGFTDLYIADLDAIIDCSTNFGVLNQIAEETGLQLIVDAGITSLERAKKLLDAGVSKVVIGTETLQNKNFVAEAVKAFGNERVIVSLDLKGEKVLVKIGFSGCLNPLCLLGEFKEMGISNVIVLDLARVGSGEGVNVDFVKKAKAEVEMDLYVGGGVRDVNDIVELDCLGVSSVLVASALHNGKITVEELRQKRLL